jgi:hypothetical protein
VDIGTTGYFKGLKITGKELKKKKEGSENG